MVAMEAMVAPVALVIPEATEEMEMMTNPPRPGQTTRMSTTSSNDNDGCLSSIYGCSGKLSKRTG